ncbi:aspartyl/glutamyl-tRNA(Asn/Gln) amidotransferase subunit A [Paucidesulfovibrio gracilis DSM 16080]|uniref:Glutamyl-tRNA(Gln) amidotransferase subunit A n=1 Tax=Paucidesulfovibrio gracilis DSM 16080 TaxID=1121449 RepID=A0A1T4WB28_9BACT|nr:Asp-tRNA(Asn)/Glu-tRNA(Gln) amidotransferase subunit GatA [Paucidesulfovibrio gracilis]SKA74524.1 aspartyl/glutamyl-tRNA(Asn/Gln) amidotransferase subunit A [Paucidesulfovibrio gracilis DSM 16080]
MSALHQKTLSELRTLLLDREVSVRELMSDCLKRLDETEPAVRALLEVRREEVLAEAEEMDRQGPNPAQPLWGIPVVLKDLLCARGTKTTCGSRMLEEFAPVYDATAVEHLRQAGAVLLAKANMDEFAMGSSTENSAFQRTRNPWNTDCVPGGSSGGSAATVAARQCPVSLGTDTGGSIRLPASFCGVVGLKPTYGRVSRFGMVAYGSSLDQIGPLTRSVEDAARVLGVIAGHDRRDSTSVDCPVPDYVAALQQRTDLKGLRIGLPEEYWREGLSPEVETACRAAVETLRGLGAETVPVRLSMTEYAIATYYIVAMAEASSNLARFDGVRYGHRTREASELIDMYTRSRTEGFGDEVQRRIIMGTYVLSSGYYDAYYRKAAQVRRLLRDDFRKAFASCDLLAGPVCPSTAFRVGDKADPLQMYLMDIFTISANLAGLPGMSLPVGLGETSNLPVGLQLMGPAFSEETMLGAAHCLEQALPPLPEPNC